MWTGKYYVLELINVGEWICVIDSFYKTVVLIIEENQFTWFHITNSMTEAASHSKFEYGQQLTLDFEHTYVVKVKLGGTCDIVNMCLKCTKN